MNLNRHRENDLPTCAEALRQELYRSERELTEAMHDLSQALARTERARLAYTNAFNRLKKALQSPPFR